jgi:predicted DNA-binding protein
MKKNMEIFSIRLKPETIEKLNKISNQKHLPMRTMVRSWLMERIDKELMEVNNGEEI